MKHIKKFTFQFSMLAVICVLCSVFTVVSKTSSSKVENDTRKTVIIDPGHGGYDGGAVAQDGTVEKNINLAISLKLKDQLEFGGYKTVMTRSSDVDTDESDSDKYNKKSDLETRLALMKKYPNAIYVSIHLNKFTASSAKGAQVFYSPDFKEAANLGNCIQNSISSKLQKDNERVIKKGTKSTYLLYNAKVPAVIVECGFISNISELKKLKSEEYQSQMAFAVYSGINDYFSDKKER